MLAILFHDVVYDATRADNEAASARFAHQMLSDLGVNKAVIARVEALILATRHGEPLSRMDGDMALLVDIDLAILAATPDAYAAYAGAIRREYAHVPADQFGSRRAGVLVGFLARPRIYTTAALTGLWEARARANLTAEIAAIGSQPAGPVAG